MTQAEKSGSGFTNASRIVAAYQASRNDPTNKLHIAAAKSDDPRRGGTRSPCATATNMFTGLRFVKSTL